MTSLDPRTPVDDLNRFAREIDALKGRLDGLEAPSGTSAYRTVERLAAAVAAIPITLSDAVRETGFALTNAFVTYATATLVVPAGKTQATIVGLGSATALDMTSGGLTSSVARILIGSSTSGEFPASKDAGASVVQNVLSAQHSRVYGVNPGGTITIELQIKALNPLPFTAQPSNFAQITALGTFSS